MSTCQNNPHKSSFALQQNPPYDYPLIWPPCYCSHIVLAQEKLTESFTYNTQFIQPLVNYFDLILCPLSGCISRVPLNLHCRYNFTPVSNVCKAALKSLFSTPPMNSMHTGSVHFTYQTIKDFIYLSAIIALTQFIQIDMSLPIFMTYQWQFPQAQTAKITLWATRFIKTNIRNNWKTLLWRSMTFQKNTKPVGKLTTNAREQIFLLQELIASLRFSERSAIILIWVYFSQGWQGHCNS